MVGTCFKQDIGKDIVFSIEFSVYPVVKGCKNLIKNSFLDSKYQLKRKNVFRWESDYLLMFIVSARPISRETLNKSTR